MNGRMWIELAPAEQASALAAFKAAHGSAPDFGFAPDRAWLEGCAHALSQGTRQAEPVALSTLTALRELVRLQDAGRIGISHRGEVGKAWLAAREALAASAPALQADPLSDFQEGQWWIKELDAWAKDGTPDQKRAVAVVHHMLRAAAALQAGQGEPQGLRAVLTSYHSNNLSEDEAVRLLSPTHERAAPAPERKRFKKWWTEKGQFVRVSDPAPADSALEEAIAWASWRAANE